MPWARCVLELRTSLAETKKILPTASSGPTTRSSSDRKLTQRSVCCFLTWTAGGVSYRGNRQSSPGDTNTHLVDVVGLRHRGVPAVVEDEDVGFGDPFADFVEEELLLQQKGRQNRVSTEPGQNRTSPVSAAITGITGSFQQS